MTQEQIKALVNFYEGMAKRLEADKSFSASAYCNGMADGIKMFLTEDAPTTTAPDGHALIKAKQDVILAHIEKIDAIARYMKHLGVSSLTYTFADADEIHINLFKGVAGAKQLNHQPPKRQKNIV